MSKLEDAIEFLDIEGWIEDYTDVKYGGANEVRIKECPKCFNSKWKVYINVEKRRWYCQSCQWGQGQGDICSLLAAVSGKNIHVVRMDLMSTIVPSLPENDFTRMLSDRLSGVKSEEEFNIEPIDLPGSQGLTGRSGAKAGAYLRSRGMTSEEIEYYKLRLSSKFRNNTGPWAVFPIVYFGSPVACQGRRFLNNSEPRYLSSDSIANWMWPLDPSNLGNIEKGSVVLVEGVFDALAYIRAGIPALCTFGKNLTRSQIKLLKAHNVTRVFLSYDADAYKGIIIAARKISHIFKALIVDLEPPEWNPKADPGDVLAGKIDQKWLLDSIDSAIEIDSDEFWNWQLRKELGE